MKVLRSLGAILVMTVMTVGFASAQTWTRTTNNPPASVGAVLLLTDGRVLAHAEQSNSSHWYTLTPDINGSYVNGTWAATANMPAGYAPLYFASAVLKDGKVIVEGGEYNNLGDAWTTLGALYDPVANAWTSVTPPSGWTSIGDSPSIVLDNGTYLLTNCCNTPPKAATSANDGGSWTSSGSGKFDVYDEEGEVKLPGGGKVLTVDAYVFKGEGSGTGSEIYDPNSGAWTGAGSTIVQLWDSCGSYEEGPGVLMPNGTVFWNGATGCGGPGHTAYYTLSSSSWTAGPNYPTVGGATNLDTADAPAVLEPSGKVIVMTSPGIFNNGSIFFEWDGSSLTQVPGPPAAPSDSSYVGHLMNLPNGQIMFTDFSNDVEIYSPTGSPDPSWAPTVIVTHTIFTHGQTYTLFGNKFNGVSEANEYGDDYQAASNYPIVRITNTATNHVFYCRTHDHSTMAVGFVGPTYTHVDIPAGIETGGAMLEVVANGIASAPARIGIN